LVGKASRKEEDKRLIFAGKKDIYMPKYEALCSVYDRSMLVRKIFLTAYLIDKLLFVS